VCLPIWMNFMASVLGRFPADDFFPEPVTVTPTDRMMGDPNNPY